MILYRSKKLITIRFERVLNQAIYSLLEKMPCVIFRGFMKVPLGKYQRWKRNIPLQIALEKPSIKGKKPHSFKAIFQQSSRNTVKIITTAALTTLLNLQLTTKWEKLTILDTFRLFRPKTLSTTLDTSATAFYALSVWFRIRKSSNSSWENLTIRITSYLALWLWIWILWRLD